MNLSRRTVCTKLNETPPPTSVLSLVLACKVVEDFEGYDGPILELSETMPELHVMAAARHTSRSPKKMHTCIESLDTRGKGGLGACIEWVQALNRAATQ